MRLFLIHFSCGTQGFKINILFSTTLTLAKRSVVKTENNVSLSSLSLCTSPLAPPRDLYPLKISFHRNRNGKAICILGQCFLCVEKLYGSADRKPVSYCYKLGLSNGMVPLTLVIKQSNLTNISQGIPSAPPHKSGGGESFTAKS